MTGLVFFLGQVVFLVTLFAPESLERWPRAQTWAIFLICSAIWYRINERSKQ
jgi:hypothetical protein